MNRQKKFMNAAAEESETIPQTTTAGQRPVENLVPPSQEQKDFRHKETESKDSKEEKDEAEKKQGIRLGTFLQINRDLLSTAGSTIERAILHGAAIAVFTIWLVAYQLSLRKKVPRELKGDWRRVNNTKFRAKARASLAKVSASVAQLRLGLAKAIKAVTADEAGKSKPLLRFPNFKGISEIKVGPLSTLQRQQTGENLLKKILAKRLPKARGI